MSELALAWRFARRELRGGLQGFVVFLACLTLGVAAIATVGVINAGVVDAVQRDAAALLGGDIRLETSNLPIAEDELAGLMPAAHAAPTPCAPTPWHSEPKVAAWWSA